MRKPAPVLVVSAWEPEIRPLRRILATTVGAPVVLATAGIGAIEAALGAARAIAAARPSAVVFVGTAGVYPSSAEHLPIGAAAIASTVHLVSFTAVSGDAYLPRRMPARVEGDRALRRAIRKASGAGEATIACPLAITRSAAVARRIELAIRAELENLEAFGVARAAAAGKVPFAAVLGVSNAVGAEAHAEWLAHHAEASRAACQAVLAWLAGAA